MKYMQHIIVVSLRSHAFSYNIYYKRHLKLSPQENRPAGTNVLQLTVTDRDASHNGPPFTFAIVDGNEGDAFRINQQGALVAVGPLDRKSREHYLLQAQVSRSY